MLKTSVTVAILVRPICASSHPFTKSLFATYVCVGSTAVTSRCRFPPIDAYRLLGMVNPALFLCASLAPAPLYFSPTNARDTSALLSPARCHLCPKVSASVSTHQHHLPAFDGVSHNPSNMIPTAYLEVALFPPDPFLLRFPGIPPAPDQTDECI